MNKVEYSKQITGEKEVYYFTIDNLNFCLSTFGNHIKAYIYLLNKTDKFTNNGHIQKCLYTVEEDNTRVVTDIENYFVFIGNNLKDKIDDYLFKDYNLNKKLEEKLKPKGENKNEIKKI